jgi:hypothetical protein
METQHGIFCPACKKKNLAGSLTCVYCLAPLYTHPANVSTTLNVARLVPEDFPHWVNGRNGHETTNGLVLVVDEKNIPLVIQPEQAVVLGRDKESMRQQPGESIVDLAGNAAYEKGVSRRHALIRHADFGYEICDLESTNGTWLNKVRLIPGRFYRLGKKNEVMLGRLFIWLLVAEETNTREISPEADPTI